MPIATRNCDQCGREYSRRRESEVGKYCSISCASISRRKDTVGRCEQCGSEFTFRASKRARRYCSPACFADSLRRQVDHSCDHCGASFTRVPTQSGKHCSKACAYAAHRKASPKARRMLILPDHPLALSSPHIPEYRVLLYEAIGPGVHPCYHCGVSVEWRPGDGSAPGALVVDHLDRNPLNNSLENLAPSCQRCNIMNSERVVADEESFRTLRGGTRLRGLPRNCEYCGGPFVTWTKNPGPGKGRFCSRSCARKGSRVT
ncbi:HNH endonuclease [Streptomyces sp. BH104]|uniref:HNH endonuclease n=1 Tax=Streptomyces sp. BH104 TaxID=3410407 RepID=UPI003BB5B858